MFYPCMSTDVTFKYEFTIFSVDNFWNFSKTDLLNASLPSRNVDLPSCSPSVVTGSVTKLLLLHNLKL